MVYKLILPERGLRNLHVRELTLHEKYLISIMSFKTTKVVAFYVKEFQRLIRFLNAFSEYKQSICDTGLARILKFLMQDWQNESHYKIAKEI